MSDRLREAEYRPWGMNQRGLSLTFDNGLLMTASQNVVAFRLLLDYGGSPLHPAMREWPSLLHSYRRSKRILHMRSRKGDTPQTSELQRVVGLIGARWGVLTLHERVTPETLSAAGGRWIVSGLFFMTRWWRAGDAIRNALDDIEKLLADLRTSPAR